MKTPLFGHFAIFPHVEANVTAVSVIERDDSKKVAFFFLDRSLSKLSTKLGMKNPAEWEFSP